jgi:hypothetical protein
MPKLLSDGFRDRAEQDRLAAARTSTPAERRALLEAAEQWERLAGQWETWVALAFGNHHARGSPLGQGYALSGDPTHPDKTGCLGGEYRCQSPPPSSTEVSGRHRQRQGKWGRQVIRKEDRVSPIAYRVDRLPIA